MLVFGLFFSPWLLAEPPAKELNEVRSKIDQLDKSLSADKQSKEQLDKQLRAQSLKVSEITRALKQTEQAIDEQDQQVKKLQQQLGEQQAEQQAQLEALYQQLRAAFMHAQPGYLKILLNQQDPALISRHHAYYRYFHKARQQQLADQ